MFEYSVLMSVYHKESPGFLRASMQSMFNQTIPPSDFVLVCDGPLTEALDAVISSFQAEYSTTLQVIRLEKNMGLGSALNEGLTHCKYEYIARMDSDDIALPHRIAKQHLAIRATGADIISGTVAEFDQVPGDKNTCRKLPDQHDQIREFAKKRNPF
ncbi:MAG: glycosyltransferase, partial [Firmicutes bacterium]|nr:glycosyltransferase [Bacillota bacterium]